jgi:hypothetical protein
LEHRPADVDAELAIIASHPFPARRPRKPVETAFLDIMPRG